MGFRRHSGYAGLACADWAYTTSFGNPEALLGTADSRMRTLVEFVQDHPGNPDRVDPHIIRNEGPALILSDPNRAGALMTLNPVVLGKAWIVVLDVHSECAGVADAYPDYDGANQFGIQTQLVHTHGQRFADMLAVVFGHPYMVIVTWTEFEPKGRQVLDIREIRRFNSSVAFTDDSWQRNIPAGLRGVMDLTATGLVLPAEARRSHA
jgi:hypothetical protein